MQVLDATLPIESLIPHRPPMLLVDRVIAAGPERLLACAQLTPDAPFCSPQGVPAAMGLEYLGQAAAAFFSVQPDANVDSTPPRPGMLIGSRSYACNGGFFPVSHSLIIEIEPATTVGSTGLVKFRGAIYVLTTDEAQRSELLQTTATALGTLCTYLTTAEPFAQGDLSVYLPPVDPTRELIQS